MNIAMNKVAVRDCSHESCISDFGRRQKIMK